MKPATVAPPELMMPMLPFVKFTAFVATTRMDEVSPGKRKPAPPASWEIKLKPIVAASGVLSDISRRLIPCNEIWGASGSTDIHSEASIGERASSVSDFKDTNAIIHDLRDEI